MTTVLDISEGLRETFADLLFPVWTLNPATGAREITGDSESPSEVQVCPLDQRYQADKCSRGMKPSRWNWQVILRFEGTVLTPEVFREWAKRPPIFQAEGIKWRLSIDNVKDHYRPSNNSLHGSKLTVDLTLVSY